LFEYAKFVFKHQGLALFEMRDVEPRWMIVVDQIDQQVKGYVFSS
jgi:hypothetical protein